MERDRGPSRRVPATQVASAAALRSLGSQPLALYVFGCLRPVCFGPAKTHANAWAAATHRTIRTKVTGAHVRERALHRVANGGEPSRAAAVCYPLPVTDHEQRPAEQDVRTLEHRRCAGYRSLQL